MSATSTVRPRPCPLLARQVADSGTEIVIGLEGRVGPGNRWMGFGFSPVNATDVTMPGSDAVVGKAHGGVCSASANSKVQAWTALMRVHAVSSQPFNLLPSAAGMVGGECFALDYLLQASELCPCMTLSGRCGNPHGKLPPVALIWPHPGAAISFVASCLQIRSQCSYPEMSGVCPDSALSGNQADNQVQLLSCEKVSFQCFIDALPGQHRTAC